MVGSHPIVELVESLILQHTLLCQMRSWLTNISTALIITLQLDCDAV